MESKYLRTSVQGRGAGLIGVTFQQCPGGSEAVSPTATWGKSAAGGWNSKRETGKQEPFLLCHWNEASA